MIQLYGRRNSINVQKVSWALCELNLEFTWHDEHGKFGTVNVENYEKLNPQLIVPTLDYNGTIINQSNASYFKNKSITNSDNSFLDNVFLSGEKYGKIVFSESNKEKYLKNIRTNIQQYDPMFDQNHFLNSFSLLLTSGTHLDRRKIEN